MKKVFLIAYTKLNLGDDIFLTILLKKYSEIQFFINIPDIKERKFLIDIRNINFIEYSTRRDINIEEYDAFVYIGGSVFMEHAWEFNEYIEYSEFVLKCKQMDKPFFYISSNFGPHNTKEYFEVSELIIRNCKDVCFRDIYSYNLFSHIPSVRYQPDVILGYDIKNINQQKDTVGISVIGFDMRNELSEYEEKYYNLLKNSIKMYIKEGKSVVLFSFCKFELDEIGIEKLLKYFSIEELLKIRLVKYDGDIEVFINEYKNIEYMIVTRFHSMILSAICNQKIYCLSYSKKINNVVEDLNFEINIKNIDEIEEEEFINLQLFRKVNEEKIEKIKEYSKKQLEEFGKFVKFDRK